MATPDIYQQIANAAAGYSNERMQTNPYTLIGQGISSYKPTFSNPWKNLAANLAQNLVGGALSEGARQSNIGYQNQVYQDIGNALAGGQLQNAELNPYLQEIQLTDARHKQDLIEKLVFKDADYRAQPDYQAQVAYGGDTTSPYASLIQSLVGGQPSVVQQQPLAIEADAAPQPKTAEGRATQAYKAATQEEELLPGLSKQSLGKIDLSIGNPKIDISTIDAPTPSLEAPLSPVEALRQAKGNRIIAQNLLQESQDRSKFALELDKRERDVKSKQFSEEESLRNKYLASKEIDGIGEVKTSLEKVLRAGIANDRSADRELGMATAKISDPTTAAMQGEVAAFMESRTIPEYIKDELRSQSFGESGFSPKARRKLMDIARRTYEARREVVLETNRDFEELSNSYGLDSKKIAFKKMAPLEEIQDRVFADYSEDKLIPLGFKKKTDEIKANVTTPSEGEVLKTSLYEAVDPSPFNPSFFDSVKEVAGDVKTNIGKSVVKGGADFLGLASTIGSLAAKPFTGFSIPEEAGAEQKPSVLEELRLKYVGEPEYKTKTGKIVGKAAEALPTAAIPFGGGLAARGLSAALSGAGGQIAKNMGAPEIVGNLIGGGLPAAGSGVVKGLGKAFDVGGDALVRRGIGAGKAHYSKALRKSGLIAEADEVSETTLKKAIKEVDKLGGFDGVSKSPNSLLNKNTEKLNILDDQLTSILEKADSVNKTEIIPNYEITKKFINSSMTERTNLTQAFNEVANELNKTLDGTLASVQKAKTQLYGKVYGENTAAKETVNKYIAADFKNIIENTVDDLVKKEAVPSTFAGQVKKLNKESGYFQQVRPILEGAVASSESSAPLDKVMNLLGVKGGGIFKPTVIAAGAGTTLGPIGALAGGLAGAAQSIPGTFALARGAQGVGGLLEGLGQSAPSLGSSLARGGLISLGNSTPQATPAVVPQVPAVTPKEETPVIKNKNLLYTEKEVPTEEVSKKQVSFQREPMERNKDLDRLFKAVIKQESAGNPNAVSNVGAVGLMQIMPATAKQIAKELGVKDYDLRDPETNKRFGEHYLTGLLKMFDGDIRLALTAYHSGPGRVQKLLQRTKGSSLDDIIHLLGPVGQKYAKGVIKKMSA